MSFYQDLPQIHFKAQQAFESCSAKNGFNDFGDDEYQPGLEVWLNHWMLPMTSTRLPHRSCEQILSTYYKVVYPASIF